MGRIAFFFFYLFNLFLLSTLIKNENIFIYSEKSQAYYYSPSVFFFFHFKVLKDANNLYSRKVCKNDGNNITES